MRNPKDIIHNGQSVANILAKHDDWRAGRTGGERANLGGANLGDADLRGADLWGADLRDADLRDANLRGANLGDADLRGADLWDADLRAADLRDANLRGADLWDADLRAADLRDANLRGANLGDADLRGADLWDADLRAADLRDVTGNMSEIRSMHVDTWPVAWITDPDGEVTVQIGCQRHPLVLWEKSDPRWIAALDRNAPEWWAKHRDLVLGMIRACPATPYGKAPE